MKRYIWPVLCIVLLGLNVWMGITANNLRKSPFSGKIYVILISPASLVNESVVHNIFFNQPKIESPIYFFTDKTSKILDVFCPRLWKEEDLGEWLKRTLLGI